MPTDISNLEWDSLSYEEKNRELYQRQKRSLELFLERGAISPAQYEKGLHDLTIKMGMRESQCSGK